MTARVTSVFLYVKDVRRSLDFYNEVVGAEIVQVHAEHDASAFDPGDPADRSIHADAASPGAACG